MAVGWAVLLVLVSVLDARAHFTPTWAVHIPDGKEAADAVAAEHGFVNLGEVTSELKTAINRLTLFPQHPRVVPGTLQYGIQIMRV
ncbi:peptidase s8 pro-domain-containing protein [Phthorimaea operculella]|nr:peptidase s8 pro-domain-containing protein [Phthorimaea operculella]